MTRLYPVSRSIVPVVSLDDMKLHLREESDDQDDLIESLTAAVTQHIDGPDGTLQRAIVDQVWDLALPSFGYKPIVIPVPPLLEIEFVKYYDAANVLQTYSAASYETVGVGGSRWSELRLVDGSMWPLLFGRAEPVVIRFRAGYLDMGNSPPTVNVPEPIKAAIKLMVGTLYDNRETIVLDRTAIELPWAAEALLAPYRVYA